MYLRKQHQGGRARVRMTRTTGVFDTRPCARQRLVHVPGLGEDLRTVSVQADRDVDPRECGDRVLGLGVPERERAIEGDWVIRRARREEAARREESRRRPEEAVAAPLAATEPGERRALGWIVAAFLLGVLIGVAVLFGYAWMRVPAG